MVLRQGKHRQMLRAGKPGKFQKQQSMNIGQINKAASRVLQKYYEKYGQPFNPWKRKKKK